MKMQSDELSGVALDWAVAKCEGLDPHIEPDFDGLHILLAGEFSGETIDYFPSTNWAQAGDIIQREFICTTADHSGIWLAYTMQNYNDELSHMQSGTTPLIAAMRCYVASRLGDEVEIPDELLDI